VRIEYEQKLTSIILKVKDKDLAELITLSSQEDFQ